MSGIISPLEVSRERAARAAESERRLTVSDYNARLEGYLREVRDARGYTDRDPSEYYNSKVERWAQDARDWVDFRDRVMTYGLEVLNYYGEHGFPPCGLDEFDSRLREIKVSWTVDMPKMVIR